MLGLVTLLIFLPVTRFDFVDYDDNAYITENNIVQNGLTLSGFNWAFTTGYAENWFPVTWLSHMADCALFQLYAGGHHATNALLHSVNSGLLFLLLLRLTGKQWPSLIVAAFFAWHPVHVESVAWVAERKDVLSTFFALLALLNYTRFVREKSRPHYWLALGCFALGLMSKPMLVTLPFVLLLLDFWPLQRFSLSAFPGRLVLEKVPFFVLTLASCAVTLVVQRPAMASSDVMPFPFRLANALVACGRYLLKLAWPADLAIFYPLAQISSWPLAASVLVLAAISIAVWLARHRNRCWLVGWCWFLGTLVPVSGLVFVGSAALADRYTYIPSIGLFIAVAFGGYQYLENRPRRRPVCTSGVILLLITCVLLTEHQLTFWRDSETLFRHALAVTANNGMAHENLGAALELQGRNDEALAEYRQALVIDPAHFHYHFYIGEVLMKQGHPAAAEAEYRLRISQNPGPAFQYNALGNALAAQNKLAEALAAYAEAERRDTQYSTPHLGVAKILFQQGQATNAVTEIWTAVRLEPYNCATLTEAARLLAANENVAVRDGHNAVIFALKANDLSGGRQWEVFDALGMAFAASGDFTNAVSCAESALEIARDQKRSVTNAVSRRLGLYQRREPWYEALGTTNAPPAD